MCGMAGFFGESTSYRLNRRQTGLKAYQSIIDNFSINQIYTELWLYGQ